MTSALHFIRRNGAAFTSTFSLATVALLSQPGLAQTASGGCSTDALASGIYQMPDGDVVRSYRLYVPANYDPTKPTPMIMVFHGWGGDENSILDHEVVTRLADEQGYILVAPRGVGSEGGDDNYNSWTFRGSATGLDGDGLNAAVTGDSEAICDFNVTGDYHYNSCEANDTAVNSCSWTQCQTDDVAFVSQLLAQVENQFCVDTDRVFASGGSNGGMFTWDLGQNNQTAPNWRAIAPIIGLPHRGYLDGPGRSDGLPVILFTGKNDPTVPPGNWEDASFTTTSDGDVFYYTGATAITRVWAEAQGCSIAESAAVVDVGIEGVECRSYCAAGADGAMPAVLDCRADMAHDYDLEKSWGLILSYFGRLPQR